jgi:transposase
MAKAPADPKPPVVDDVYRIADALWIRIAELLPPRPVHPLGCHRRRVDDRKAMDALFFVFRTGCQWNALNATSICSAARPTAASRSGPQPASSASCGGSA